MKPPRVYSLRWLRSASAAVCNFTAGHCCPVAVRVAAAILRDYFTGRNHLPPRLDGNQLAAARRRAEEIDNLAETVAALIAEE